jgi:hypothetical protein
MNQQAPPQEEEWMVDEDENYFSLGSRSLANHGG